MKTAQLLVAVLFSLVAATSFARAPGGMAYPVCFEAGRVAASAIDARNHDFTREEARRGEFIPSEFVHGNTPQWVANLIDPYLNAAYAVPMTQKVDADAVAEQVFQACRARYLDPDVQAFHLFRTRE